MKRTICANCTYFKKLRGYPFGECNNDDLLQYCEEKKDLKELSANSLVVVGKGNMYVGVEFFCPEYAW